MYNIPTSNVYSDYWDFDSVNQTATLKKEIRLRIIADNFWGSKGMTWITKPEAIGTTIPMTGPVYSPANRIELYSYKNNLAPMSTNISSYSDIPNNMLNSGNFEFVEKAPIEKVVTPAPREETDSSQRVKDTLLVNKSFSWTDDLLEIETSKQSLYDSNGNEVTGMEINKYFDDNGNYLGGLYSSPQATPNDEILPKNDPNRPNSSTIGRYIVQSYIKIPKELSLQLHVGSESDRTNKIEVSIANLSSVGLGVDKLSSNRIGIVDNTGLNATDAIDVVADALKILSSQRANLGAIQNRLEHTIKNLDNVVENTTSSESQIRDTDMAEEMVKNSNNNVLQQAGQAMLAQANQSNQGVLSLLQ